MYKKTNLYLWHMIIVLSGEATNTDFIDIVFGLTRSGLEPMIYRTHEGQDNAMYSTCSCHDKAKNLLNWC
jgi:hypothetical protein